jgi:type I restriction enzyme S subunit
MVIERVRVGDVLQLDRKPVQPDPSVDYVSIGIRSFGKGIFHYEPKLGSQLGRLRFFEVQPDRLIISNIKGWEGAVAVSSEDDRGCLASNRFLSYAPSDNRIDINWARWYFLSEPGLEQIRRASPGSADRNRTLAIERFEALEIPLPTLDEQRHVAERLDKLTAVALDLIQRSKRATHLSEAFAISFSARPDLADNAKSEAGWRRVPLASVMTPAVDRVTIEPGRFYPNVGIYSFGRGLFAKPDIDGSATSAKTVNRVRAGQFIYSRLFAFEGAYGHVPEEFEGSFVSNEFPTFDVDAHQLNAQWLANYLRSPDRWAELRGASKGLGVRRQRIPVEAVMAYEVWLPPIEQQLAVIASLKSIEAAQRRRSESVQRMESLVPAAVNEEFARLS